MEVNLRTQQGETTHRIAGPLTFPGAGNRHFFGAMPEPGDLCVVGWSPQESGYTKRPFIVGWLVPGTTAGYDWLPTQPFGPEEFGLSPKSKHQLDGIATRVRHKLRSLNPGNIAGSSSQGSDFVLDESVYLANRRGNDIRLRDQDQALVVRTQQQFHVGAGFRSYFGMVQRDGRFLPTQMFADNKDWAAPRQVDAEKQTLSVSDLADGTVPAGLLTPAGVFQRDADGVALTSQAFPTDIDPYDFLQRGLFITAEGYARDNPTADTIYGGKPIYRVSTEGTNATADTSVSTLTEHRVEVSHTWDGTLPVSEQTEGFDADRLPSGNPQDTDPLGASPNAPFIHFVLGSVVGNDAFTDGGREVYGLPLRAVIFDGDVRAPVMVSALGTPIEQHAASLFSVRPPLTPNAPPTFWTVGKDGRVLASITGPGDTWSAEVAMLAGLRLGSGAQPNGRSIQADLDGALFVRAKRGGGGDNIGIDLSSDQGAVRLFAGGSTTMGGIGAQTASGEGSGGLPGLMLESATNILLRASKTITISGTRLDLTNLQELNLNANSGLNFQSGGSISHSSNTYAQGVMGKAEYTFSGPKGANPANGAIRDTKIIANPATGFPGGPADQYLLLYGDRAETLLAGNHFTNVAVGNQFYNVGAGSFGATAVSNTMVLSPAGAAMTATTGTALVASSGATAITAGAAVTVQAATLAVIAGAVAFTSPTGLHSIGPQIPGAILTDGCLNPLTGLPFVAAGTLGIQTLRVF